MLGLGPVHKNRFGPKPIIFKFDEAGKALPPRSKTFGEKVAFAFACIAIGCIWTWAKYH